VVATFKSFAEQENKNLRAKFDSLVGHFIVDPVGRPMPMTVPKKFEFIGIQLEAAPTTFSFDVRRTDSLITPYVGYLEWPLVFLKATTHAKGPSEFCSRQPLSTCLEHDGTTFESSMIYKDSAQRFPRTVRYEYVYEDQQWKPKKDLNQVLNELVGQMNVSTPIPPSRVPGIFGVPPARKQPQPEEPDDQKPPSDGPPESHGG
jgi:hypothetical protein